MTPHSALQEFVRIKSLSSQESEAADWIVQLGQSFGWAMERQGNNVWAHLGPRSESGRVLLVSHSDTVPAGNHWTADPWEASWKEGRLTGLGSNDAKGCGTAMLFAAAELAKNGPVSVAIVAEEETGGPGGITSVLAAISEGSSAAIVGEPTRCRACTAQRGMLMLRGTATGVSAHVAHTGLGENAIVKAAQDILVLEQMQFEPHEVLGTTRAQVTMIQGGTEKNMVPDACELFVDLRTTPNLNHEQTVAEIAAQTQSRWTVHSHRYVPKSTPAGHPIGLAAIEASGEAPIGSPTVSDWAFLGELPAVKAGPGDTLRSHTPDEYLLWDELTHGIEFYQKAVSNYWRLAR